MIGPHQDKELELMLAGKKHLAIFYDAQFPDGDIPEQIIPEKAFAPYVANGTVQRFCHDVTSPKTPFPIRYVCFVLTGHEWRAHAFYWMNEVCMKGERPFDDAYEYFVGRLLDYSEEDIAHFIHNLNERRLQK